MSPHGFSMQSSEAVAWKLAASKLSLPHSAWLRALMAPAKELWPGDHRHDPMSSCKHWWVRRITSATSFQFLCCKSAPWHLPWPWPHFLSQYHLLFISMSSENKFLQVEHTFQDTWSWAWEPGDPKPFCNLCRQMLRKLLYILDFSNCYDVETLLYSLYLNVLLQALDPVPGFL